ncbi:hypothetical protein XENORESO_017153 [Xenotaenia resolanae]|uniref:Uncharacterized protein n=1 Tax=Xenotaenia resolanae TaxID=208358 RepID=A0ABV0WA13_9TELE
MVCAHSLYVISTGRIIFSWKCLLSLRQALCGVLPENIPAKIGKTDKKPCRQRRGRRGRIWHKLRKITFNIRCVLLALPTILLSKLQSIWNKFEKLKAWIKSTPERTKTCLLDFTEMGLGESEQDEELSLVDWTTTPTS